MANLKCRRSWRNSARTGRLSANEQKLEAVSSGVLKGRTSIARERRRQFVNTEIKWSTVGPPSLKGGKIEKSREET